MKKSFLFLLMILGFTSACSTMAPSEAQINAEAAKAYAEVKAKSKLSKDPELNALVQRVAKRIAESSGENFEWETILIESPEVNAWCMPGGKMAVYTGILPVAQNEAALAAIMGHEVAHATLRHGKERYARAVKGNVLGAVVGVGAAVGGQLLCRTSSCRVLTGLSGAAAGLAITFFDRKFSREDESEADKAGQVYMAKAGYPPAEAIELWKRMGAAAGGKSPPEFLSTHPSDVRRRANLSSWLPETEAIYEQAPQKHGLGAQIKTVKK